jgi:hypothetical protein
MHPYYWLAACPLLIGIVLAAHACCMHDCSKQNTHISSILVKEFNFLLTGKYLFT